MQRNAIQFFIRRRSAWLPKAKAGTMALRLLAAIFALGIGTTVTSDAQSSANRISFQGALTGASGQPLPNGNYDLTFKFYDGPTNPAAMATSSVPNVSILGGMASTSILVDPVWFDGR